MNTEGLFNKALEWLDSNYENAGPFFEERDVVLEIQKQIRSLIKREEINMRVISEYAIYEPFSGRKEALYPDLAIVEGEGENEKARLIVQFKYEPGHERIKDFRQSKFYRERGKGSPQSVVCWPKCVIKDVENIKKCVDGRKVDKGYLIFIDEGNYFKCKKNKGPAEGAWKD